MEEWQRLLNLVLEEGLDRINSLSDEELREAMANVRG